MKKTIVFGSILSVFILLTIPNISAVEYQTRKEVVSNEIKEKIAPLKRVSSFSIEEIINKNSQIDVNDTDLIDELLLFLLLLIYNIQIYFFMLRIEWYENGVFSNFPDLEEILALSIEASNYNLFFFVGLVYDFADSFIKKTERLPEIVEFIITSFSIPFFVLLYLVNIFFWFIFCYILVYFFYADWGPIFTFIFKILVIISIIISNIVYFFFNFPVMNYFESKVDFC